uniref:DNA-directed RNA polymerase n=2 Tax=Ignatiaceae TaxID=2682551 RepID=A0A1W6EGS6_9CHLO|nr:alpha subunit of RNA polymerase [Pseudocharacium americanum]YP_009367734.1 alpha subunit of RNA polymerase [Ignatius tetrasporus]ARK14602.1 alpha subunit of RNA polymerase [Pseudocharacium americanum]ARK14691.1 alpha subunit of RNA polymerase [Ignatius tetrasporus]
MEPFLLSCIDSKIENNRSFYGRFQLGPFDTGQGITLANALRRTLLSELTGLAITLIEIQGVSHEYSSILGVRESILDILQNLKQLVFKSDFQVHEPQIGYLIISGPAVVRAGDLKLPLPIQCVDPEQYIATLSYNGYLNIKFIINQGKKYIIQTPVDSDYLKQCSILKNFHFPKTNQLNQWGGSSNFNESQTRFKLHEPINRAKLDFPNQKTISPIEPINRKSILPSERSEIPTTPPSIFFPSVIPSGGSNDVPSSEYPPSKITINENSTKNKGFEPGGLSFAQTEGQEKKNNFIGSSEFAINKYLLSKEWFVKKKNQSSRLIEDRAKRSELDPPDPSPLARFPQERKNENTRQFYNQGTEKSQTNLIGNTTSPFSSIDVTTMSKEPPIEPRDSLNEANFPKTISSDQPSKIPPLKRAERSSISPNVRSEFPSSPIRPISGFFPIDALFMPINKVNYIIELDENYENSKERVILEIWTNGSLHPRQAIHDAIKCLIELFRPFQKTRFTQFFSSSSVKTTKKTLNNVKFKILFKNNMSSVQFSGPQSRSRKGLKETNERSQWEGGYPTHRSVSQLDEAQSFPLLQISEAKLSQPGGSNEVRSNNLNLKKISKISPSSEDDENTKINNFRNLQYQKLHLLFKRKLETLDIGNFDFSLKLYIQLKSQNINTISELLKYSSEDLFQFKNIKKHDLEELNNVLSQVGLNLRDSSNN